MKYFSDYHGATVQLDWTEPMPNKEFAARFPGIKGLRYDSFNKRVGRTGVTVLPLTRCIDYKANPSLHQCNARCLGAKPNGACECSCGGKNHGLGFAAQEGK